MTDFDHLPRRRFGRATALTPLLLAALIVSLAVVRSLTIGVELPTRLSDDEFWDLIHDASEPGGTFPSDNYVSNESRFQVVIPRLRETVEPGGVYLGVGPDQNFTYIAALRPAVAFIVDIRRQNLLHHLLYKALIELSPDRETFVERLFSRPRPRSTASAATTDGILNAALARPHDEVAYRRNLRDVLDRLRLVHGFALSPEDQQTIDEVYSAFYSFGPEISYVSPATSRPASRGNGFGPQSRFPTYADLMLADDGLGTNWAYLGSEDAYQTIRSMQLNNLIVPIVGDFAGSRALRTVGQWVRSRQASVTTLYTSNVEQYLFQDDRLWTSYYSNVAELPTNAQSTFIRAHFPTPAFTINSVIVPGGRRMPIMAPRPVSGRNGFIESYSLLDPVHELLQAVDAGYVRTYLDVIHRSK